MRFFPAFLSCLVLLAPAAAGESPASLGSECRTVAQAPRSLVDRSLYLTARKLPSHAIPFAGMLDETPLEEEDSDEVGGTVIFSQPLFGTPFFEVDFSDLPVSQEFLPLWSSSTSKLRC